jgi:hypothetical protein
MLSQLKKTFRFSQVKGAPGQMWLDYDTFIRCNPIWTRHDFVLVITVEVTGSQATERQD